MKRYGFYGWENAGTRETHGLTPRALYDLLSDLWCAETCTPRMRADWTPDNPTLGQCAITAFLVQDLFGGRVYGVPTEDGGTHCFNEVDGCVFDLTSEQFGEKGVDYAGYTEQFREKHFLRTEKNERYGLLREKLARCLEVIGPGPLLEIRVRCEEALTVEGRKRNIVMIPFSGTVSGAHFAGETEGTGVDTQIWAKDGSGGLSARYMLRGKDSAGKECRIFVQNEGNPAEGFHPIIATDSERLGCWESLPLVSTVDPIEGGVLVRIRPE